MDSILGILFWIPCLGVASYHVPGQPYGETHGMGLRPDHNYVSELESNPIVPSQVFR